MGVIRGYLFSFLILTAGRDVAVAIVQGVFSERELPLHTCLLPLTFTLTLTFTLHKAPRVGLRRPRVPTVAVVS
jgi:hypothetical protein